MGFLGELFAMFLLVLVVVHKVKMKAPSELITTKAEKVAIVKGEKNYSRIRESGQRLLLLVCYRRRSHPHTERKKTNEAAKNQSSFYRTKRTREW